MKNLKILSLIAIVTIIFTACKKDDPATPTTLQKLQGKWNFQKGYYHEYYNGSHSYDTSFAVAGDYADFRTDGKVYFKFENDFDTLGYSVLGDNKLIATSLGAFPTSDTLNILTLTATEFQINQVDQSELPDLYEFTEFYTK